MTNSQINSLIKMLEKSPNNPLGRYGLANEYFKIGEFGKAIDQLNIYFELKDDEGAGVITSYSIHYTKLYDCFVIIRVTGCGTEARHVYFSHLSQNLFFINLVVYI